MKAKVTVLGKLLIELEGTADEVQQVLGPLEQPAQAPPIPIPVWTQCLHEYPTTWWSTTSPTCKKCGLAMTPWFTITNETPIK